MQEVVLDYLPHPSQAEFHACKARFKGFIGGIGSGKSLGGNMEAIQYMLENPGSAGVIVAPTFPMLRDATMISFFEKMPRMAYLDSGYSRGDNRLTLKNGSYVFFKSGDDPERLRGPNLSWFFVDEAALVSPKVFDILVGRIRDARFPCRGWITTTPKGFNWVYREFVEKKVGGVHKDYELIQCSSRANPYLTRDFISSLEDQYSGVFLDQDKHNSQTPITNSHNAHEHTT